MRKKETVFTSSFRSLFQCFCKRQDGTSAIQFGLIAPIFVLMLFEKADTSFMDNTTWPCFFVFLQMLLNVIRHAYSIMSLEMRYAMGALFLSHGVSFVYNYLMKGEYAKIKPDRLMGSPYGRVVVMHVAIIFGAFLTAALGSPVGILIILVGLKTSLDVIFHLRQHKKHQAKTAKA